MSEGNFSADIIVIITIAAFVVYKYRQILGHKTGHDVETPRPKANQERVVQLKQYQQQGDETSAEEEPAQAEAPKDEALESLEDAALKKTLEQMKEVDDTLVFDEFVLGAKAAFDMVMDAYEKADRATLKMLLSDNLYREFDQELKQRAKKDEKPHTTLVSILSAMPVDATFKKHHARITIRFLSEQIYVVKDKEGTIIEGEKSRIDQVEDEWVFERQLRSRNPNWTITDM
jgi:predicted lipid-binding transport protein (Tim44 family)